MVERVHARSHEHSERLGVHSGAITKRHSFRRTLQTTLTRCFVSLQVKMEIGGGKKVSVTLQRGAGSFGDWKLVCVHWLRFMATTTLEYDVIVSMQLSRHCGLKTASSLASNPMAAISGALSLPCGTIGPRQHAHHDGLVCAHDSRARCVMWQLSSFMWRAWQERDRL